MEKYQKIFKSLNIPQIMKTYDFLNISNSDLEKMILQIIKNALTKETDEEKIKIIIKNDLDTKFQALTQKQLSNEEELLAVLQKFISSNLKKKKSSQALQEIKKFINYVKLLGVSLNVDICMKLIQENELLNNLISLLLKNSENKIKIDEYINLFDEDVEQLIGEQLITSYCLIKNIKIDNSLEEAFDENIELYDGMDSIKSYIYEITRLPLLTLEQEQELGLRILQKDKQAIDTLVEHNLRLVISIAKKYANIGGMTLLDLIQEGNIGVIKAAQRFDVTKGYRFSTYATWWIKQSITRAIADKAKSIRIPANFSQKIFKLNKISSELETKLSRKPTIEELMKETDFSAQEIEELQKNNITVLSLNANIKDDEDAELGEFIVDDNFNLEDMAQKKIFSEELRECLKNVKLNNKELEVIYLRNGFINNRVWTLEEIAKKLNVTRERIRQIENTALRKLRVNPTIKKMAIYTDNPINSLYNVGDTHSNNLPKQMEKTYNLYTILKINSKRRLDDALARLYEEEYALVIKRFGSNYQSLNTTTWTTSDNDKFKNDVLPVLKDLIANPFKYRIDVPDWIKVQRKDFSFESLEKLAKYFHKSFKQIKFILSKLYAEELDLLYKVYGENLNDFNYNDLSEKEQKIFAYELVPILERLIINPYLTREIPDWINDLRLKSNQDSQDWVKIINLYKAGKSVDDIANMTGINKIVIDNIISKIAVNNKLVRKK